MKRFETFLPYVAMLVIGWAAFWLGETSRNEEVRNLKTEVSNAKSYQKSHDEVSDVAIDKCQDAVDQANRERDEALAVVAALSDQIVELNKRNYKPAEPVRPRPGARLLNLPEDANTWYSTLFVQTDWQTRSNEAAAVRRISETGWGRDLQEQTHFRIVDIKGDMWTPTGRTGDTFENVERYWPYVPKTPALVIQKPSGEIVYRESNPDLAKVQAGLRHQINKTMRRQRHGNEKACPGPYCTPDQTNKPQPAPSDVVIQPEEPAPKPEPPTGAVVALVASTIAGFGYRFWAASR